MTPYSISELILFRSVVRTKGMDKRLEILSKVNKTSSATLTPEFCPVELPGTAYRLLRYSVPLKLFKSSGVNDERLRMLGRMSGLIDDPYGHSGARELESHCQPRWSRTYNECINLHPSSSQSNVQS